MGNKKRDSVQRKVCFYRVDAGLDDNAQPIPFDPEPFLKRIDALPFNGMGSRRSPEDDGAISCWIDRLTPPYRIYLGKSRWQGRPLTEHNGVRSPLNLDPNRSLLEGIHAVLFFDDPYWIVGCEYNFYGPRIVRLASYLSQKASCPGLSLLPLMRNDAEQRLRSLQDVRLFSIRFHPSAARRQDKSKRRQQKTRDALDVLDDYESMGNVYEAEVTLRSEPRSAKKLSPRLIEYMWQLFRNPDVHREVMDAKIKGLNAATGHVELIDVLKAQITETVWVPRRGPAGSSPESEDMYAAIEQVYEKRRTMLLLATAMTFGNGAGNESDHSVA